MARNPSLTQLARAAVQAHPDSDIQVGFAFGPPSFRSASNDRLLKVGRRVSSLIRDYDNNNNNNEAKLEASLDLVWQECEILMSGLARVPTVPFGKTGLSMPIVTLGCMRFQQEWGPRITHMNQVGADCQDNLVAILKTAVDYGITHIETARGYGSSELQLGVALQQLFATTSIRRSDLILQTKIPPYENTVAFREAIELSLTNLQVDYIDLFAFHGMNYEEQYEWVFGEGRNNCLSVVKEYIAIGKIRHLGFSTHGSTDFILKLINTNVFDYVNLHYHYFGSYTASGGGHDGRGTLDCVKLLAQKEMGCFIISPYDKGGRLYAPSKKLRNLTLPEMEPMTFKSFWLWNHHRIYENESLPLLHTFTVGAARPSDLDQPAIAAYLHSTATEDVLAKVKRVTLRLDSAKEQSLGKDWLASWWMGLPKNTASTHLIEHNQMVWLYNCIKAFGMHEFAKARYNSFEKNDEKWDEALTAEENIVKIGKNAWGFVPGRSLKPGMDYSDDLRHIPEANKDQVHDAEEFVFMWCRDRQFDKASSDNKDVVRRPLDRARLFIRRNLTSEQEQGKDDTLKEEIIPSEWETAYDLRTWLDFPDRITRII